jgi:hypothetical protein
MFIAADDNVTSAGRAGVMTLVELQPANSRSVDKKNESETKKVCGRFEQIIFTIPAL